MTCSRLLLSSAVLLVCLAQVSSDIKTEDKIAVVVKGANRRLLPYLELELTVENFARVDAVYIQGQMCAVGHVGPAVGGANVCHLALLAIGKCAGLATLT
ncbi:hypothetical protein OROGR_003606 [Orobanche gracilis]